MTDPKRKRHPYARVIVAWALGHQVEYRYQFRKGTWTQWLPMPQRNTRFSDDLTYEYRIKPTQTHPINLQYREAFLAGMKVYFRQRGYTGKWTHIDPWLEDHCRTFQKAPIWEREWLDFKIGD